MPLFSYSCERCKTVSKKYCQSPKNAPLSIVCKCGAVAKKGLGAASCSHKISIDNGVMARRVEVDPNIMEINDERAEKDYSEE